jgi:hypothetical protein
MIFSVNLVSNIVRIIEWIDYNELQDCKRQKYREYEFLISVHDDHQLNFYSITMLSAVPLNELESTSLPLLNHIIRFSALSSSFTEAFTYPIEMSL